MFKNRFVKTVTLSTVGLALTLSLAIPSAMGQEVRNRAIFTENKTTARDLVIFLNPVQQPPVGSEISISLPVKFSFDSSVLSKTAMANLNIISKALQAPELSKIKFIVEGHTDASGSEAYNEALSLRRAQSATKYLVSLGVDNGRLSIRGHGEKNLLPKFSPKAAQQRRVEFVRSF